MERIDTYLALAIDYNAEAFVSRHQESLLVLDQHAHDIDIASMIDSGRAGYGIRTGTLEMSPPDTVQRVKHFLAKLDEQALSLLVFRLVKQAVNPWKKWVTVGRAHNNDIVIPAPSVSKIHAYFNRSEQSTDWLVTDYNSRNGTAVNSISLSVQQAHVVHSGDLITFGSLALTYYSALDFYHMIQSLLTTTD